MGIVLNTAIVFLLSTGITASFVYAGGIALALLYIVTTFAFFLMLQQLRKKLSPLQIGARLAKTLQAMTALFLRAGVLFAAALGAMLLSSAAWFAWISVPLRGVTYLLIFAGGWLYSLGVIKMLFLLLPRRSRS